MRPRGIHSADDARPSYSADWGDYVSFTHRMKEKAHSQGQDLLLIDTGDRIEGNGLYDASEPKGEYTADIFKEQDIDIICSGNHELYKRNSSENEYTTTVPNFKGKYLASNLDIYDPKTGELVAMAPRYRKFTTEQQGIRVMAFGFLFDFTGNENNTVVQPVEDTIKETWFQEAIRDRDVDLFVVIGHVAIRSREFDKIYREIRKIQWDTPIQFFGGHTHIRDYKKYDDKSYALESGRYMETIGFQSISGLSTGGKGTKITARASPKFGRRYIDNNLFSFYHHTGLNESTFPTEHGISVSGKISTARKELELDQTFGCAPRDLWMNRAKYPSNESIFTLLEEQVLPSIIEDKDRADRARLVLVNTGAIRFDIFKGAFTRDSTFIVSPFTSGFRYIRDVPYKQAVKILELINKGGEVLVQSSPDLRMDLLGPVEQLSIHEDTIIHQEHSMAAAGQTPLGKHRDLTPGYTTKDDAGDDGDDTLHSPISYYRVPNCIQALTGPLSDEAKPETVDLVFIEFIQPWIILALTFVGLDLSDQDTDVYMPGTTFTTLLAEWIQENWNGDC